MDTEIVNRVLIALALAIVVGIIFMLTIGYGGAAGLVTFLVVLVVGLSDRPFRGRP